MSSQTHSQDHVVEPQRQTAAPTAPPVEKVIDEIRRDCRISPKNYLDEVEVPHGGE